MVRKMKTVCQINECTACNACIDACPVNAIRICDSTKNYNACIDEVVCIDCGACTRVCQKNTLPELRQPIMWKQGWTNDEDRLISASGGVVTAMAKAFRNNGGIVYLCKFTSGSFIFCEMKTVVQMKEFAGSKYVKSNTVEIYKSVKKSLKEDNNVLFVGLPCQIAGLKKYVGIELEKNLYTIDLICHGTPSVNLLQKYLREQGVELNKINSVLFRQNNDFNLFIDDKKLLYKGERDRYSVLFLNGKIYTENCYTCDFANIKRVSDITVGDSWGTMLEEKERKKGISLILCQTDKGKKILDDAQISLYDVELKRAVKYNHQLEQPMKKPKAWSLFFWLNGKVKFGTAAMICFPMPCLKQCVRKYMRVFRRKRLNVTEKKCGSDC